ncbi:MAG TPA: accessory factor UbiK family protein [Dongiaceae bacterium]|jgi:BMFP domain-containing protein YqiC|nr:accessory factor UbiK family protein [Dongiaceae bacterium]
MQQNNRLWDDLAKIANGAVGSLGGLKQDMEQRVQAQLERFLGRMNLVTREEFDAVRSMIVVCREEQDRLKAQIAALEAQIPAGTEKNTDH